MVYDDEFARDPTDVKAYLIKPPSDQEISSSNEPSLGSKPSLPDSKADQTMLQEPAADLQKQFQRAMIRLMLKVDVTGDDHTPQASTSARTTTTSRSASGPAPQKYPANPENKGPKLLTLSTLHIVNTFEDTPASSIDVIHGLMLASTGTHAAGRGPECALKLFLQGIWVFRWQQALWDCSAIILQLRLTSAVN
ncbi:hypothetical protein MMC13_000227 [Lambiella insularis]|nr:hypothetical protein [Lambiella insularis]